MNLCNLLFKIIICLSIGITVTSCMSYNPVFHYKQTHSYYSLLEIVEHYIDPKSNEPIHKNRVKQLLGPNEEYVELEGLFSENTWVYSSVRHVSHGHYLLINFTDNDMVESIEWASE